MNSINYRIAQLADVESVYHFAAQKHFSGQAVDLESMEIKMQIWDSAFRIESLEHHFKLGWSFVAVNSQNQIVGFFLGQALLFIDHQTQSLWIEYINAENDEILTELTEIAFKLAREKHFQRVLFSAHVKDLNLTKKFAFQPWNRESIFLKTTK